MGIHRLQMLQMHSTPSLVLQMGRENKLCSPLNPFGWHWMSRADLQSKLMFVLRGFSAHKTCCSTLRWHLAVALLVAFPNECREWLQRIIERAVQGSFQIKNWICRAESFYHVPTLFIHNDFITHIYVCVCVCVCVQTGADLGVGPEGHRPLLKSDWPLKCPCPVSHRWFTSSSLLAASVRRLKINLLNGFCLQLLVLCFQSRSSSPLREVPIQNFKVKKHIMVDVI